MNRRQFLLAAGGLAFAGISHAAWRYWPDAGLINPCLAEMPESVLQHPTYRQIWQGIRPEQVWDSHVHLVGVGDASNQTWFNPDMDSWSHPQLKLQKAFYMNGTCADPANIDHSTVAKMTQLVAAMPAGVKLMLFAFDWYRDGAGQVLKENSIFHVSNTYAAHIASQQPDRFEWVASIHPYRPDALDALDQAYAGGARAIKWLPSGMGIDPASGKCLPFYKKLAAMQLPIITHTGKESAVAGGEQTYGNPLRMRQALDQGVKVVLAHCASDGADEDLDHGGRVVKSFDLFTRMMDTPDYQPLLHGDISATTLINHAWVLPTLIARQDWHARLVNGSDYPLPGIMPLTNINTLIANGWLASEHQSFLVSLKQTNPLLYDFALKRLLSINGQTFSTQVFETRPLFERHSS
ncbi:amidohydrolase family protein [Methylophilus sp.]|uniref:amidohydrolase family protein n=1 Tax=Methylophilus sp. TaxID=29541 RepID=UPI00403559D1